MWRCCNVGKPGITVIISTFLIFLRLLDFVPVLESQIGLDYKRAMNKMTFDSVVSQNPKDFAYVTLPEPVKESLAETGACFFNLIFQLSMLNFFLFCAVFGLCMLEKYFRT